ncbi:hypothetical protein GCM10029964_033810 [Kibdelosporangium lantanae]
MEQAADGFGLGQAVVEFHGRPGFLDVHLDPGRLQHLKRFRHDLQAEVMPRLSTTTVQWVTGSFLSAGIPAT